MNDNLSLTAIVLTYNEEKHLERCLESLKSICNDIVIIDSFSDDKTQEIAQKYNVKFYQNLFVNQAAQINWAIKNVEINSNWIFRVDADEYLVDELKSNIVATLSSKIDSIINGFRIKRLMYFMDKPMKRGGMYPISHLRLWRNGFAKCEQKWMDERMVLNSGTISSIEGDLIDHNLNKIHWWTNKHNKYATREAIDILDKIYNFTGYKEQVANLFGKSEERRRWLKMKYLRLPLFLRPLIFVFVRYIIQLGFLEGTRGFVWTVLQCGWYRFLVDVKIYEAYKNAGNNKEALIAYFKQEYGYDITKVN